MEGAGKLKLKFVRWEIKKGVHLLAFGKSLIMPNQDMRAILRTEITRISKELQDQDFLSDIVINIKESDIAGSFKGFVIDRYCPDHPHDSARKHNIDPQHYSFCGRCGKKTKWVLVQNKE